MPSLMLLQSTFARVACTERTARDLDVLRNSVARACALPPGGPWDRKAAAHAEFHCLLADATGVADFALVARHISGSVQDLLTGAGPSAERLIVASRHRLLSHLEARDEDGAAQEMEDHLARLASSPQIARSVRRALTKQEATLPISQESAQEKTDGTG